MLGIVIVHSSITSHQSAHRLHLHPTSRPLPPFPSPPPPHHAKVRYAIARWRARRIMTLLGLRRVQDTIVGNAKVRGVRWVGGLLVDPSNYASIHAWKKKCLMDRPPLIGPSSSHLVGCLCDLGHMDATPLVCSNPSC